MSIPGWWAELKHFKPEEFDSPDAPGSGAIHMEEKFVRILDAARTDAGIPFIVTSGYRTRAYNIAVGGAADSDHESGRCADIACYTLTDRFKIVEAALMSEIMQIGIGDRIVHLGLDWMRAKMVGIYHPGIPGRWF